MTKTKMTPGLHGAGVPGPGVGVQGVVDAVLPRALYRVRLDDGTEITASLSSKAKQVTVSVLPGHTVMVELSPYDPSRGRIKERLT